MYANDRQLNPFAFEPTIRVRLQGFRDKGQSNELQFVILCQKYTMATMYYFNEEIINYLMAFSCKTSKNDNNIHSYNVI